MKNVYFVVGYVPYEPEIYEEKVYASLVDAKAEAARMNAMDRSYEYEVLTMKVIPVGG